MNSSLFALIQSRMPRDPAAPLVGRPDGSGYSYGEAMEASARLARPGSLSDDLVNRQILLYDRFVQPVSRLIDPITSGFFGQSLWARAIRDDR